MLTTTIYALVDPRTDLLRYIGKAVKPGRRFRFHISAARRNVRSHCYCWIRSLLAVSLEPRLEVIEECSGDGSAEERFHIALAKSDGIKLTNATDGGEGLLGFRQTPYQRRAAAESNRRRTGTHMNLSPERRAQIRRQFSAPKSRLHRERIGAAHRGKEISQKQRMEISAARRLYELNQIADRYLGKTFGSWTVIERDSPAGATHVRMVCRCECGVQGSVLAFTLISGTSTGCRRCAKRREAMNAAHPS